MKDEKTPEKQKTQEILIKVKNELKTPILPLNISQFSPHTSFSN